MSVHYWLVGFVVCERLFELVLSRRNAVRLLAAGGVEAGAAHYPLFFLVHGGWLFALGIGIPEGAPVNPYLLAMFVALQVARFWVIASLGRYWTTRIITVPGAPLVRRGPYRYLRHPNYLVVAGEIAVLPLVFGAWEIALVFSVLNAPLLYLRIQVEDKALADRPRQYPAEGAGQGGA